MNCQIFETVVNDLAREQVMEANAREEAIAHCGVCEACALRFSLERRLTSGLRALAAEMKSLSASARSEEQLLVAFRSQLSSISQTRSANRSRYWVLAAAAVVLLTCGVAGTKWWLDGSSPTAINANGKTEAPPPPKNSTVAIDYSDPAPKQTPQPKRRQSARTSGKRAGNETYVARGPAGVANATEAGNSTDNEVATQFLPLSYASPVNLQDGGQLVRVELPRSAMVNFGLPVNMERYSEKVKADVLVSADGLARAIRFVQ